MTQDVRIFPDLDELSARAAEAAVATIGGAVRANGRCSLALSGGDTPRTMHRLLASTLRDRVPWPQVHIFWGDDRYVPPDDTRSNYRMARETLLDHVPCPATNIHPMPTHLADPEEAAREYEATMQGYFGTTAPHFDLVFLGIGPDAHTASLFPNSPVLEERSRWVVPVTADAEPPLRLTMTWPVFRGARHTSVLVSGDKTADALRHALAKPADPTRYPASGIRQAAGPVVWWVDAAAASCLDQEHVS